MGRQRIATYYFLWFCSVGIGLPFMAAVLKTCGYSESQIGLVLAVSPACALIFRRNPTTPFGIGAPNGDAIGGFIQKPLNYAALKTRGLDFQARYSLDIEEMFGRNWGRLDYRIGGLWLIEQKQFLNA